MWHIIGILLLSLEQTSGLYCFEGSNCELSDCGECQGIACVRVVRPSTKQPNTFFAVQSWINNDKLSYDSDSHVAFTCLPVGTRIYDLEPEGCRADSVNERLTCVCYNNDYCNDTLHVFNKLQRWLILAFAVLIALF